MGEIYSKWRYKRDGKRGLIFGAFAGLLIFVGFLLFSSNPLIILPPLILAYLSFINLDSAFRWKKGYAGEEIVAKELEKLGDAYKVLNDI